MRGGGIKSTINSIWESDYFVLSLIPVLGRVTDAWADPNLRFQAKQ